MSALTDSIRDVTARLRAAERQERDRWSKLYVQLGHALGASEAGDETAARLALEAASDLEYSLLGHCDTIGAIIDSRNGGAR